MNTRNITKLLLDGKDLQKIKMGLVFDENGQVEYDKFVWESDDYPKPTEDELLAIIKQADSLEYQDHRRAAYPPIEEQLDAIFHKGIEGWQADIQAIKDRFPKPTKAI